MVDDETQKIVRVLVTEMQSIARRANDLAATLAELYGVPEGTDACPTVAENPTPSAPAVATASGSAPPSGPSDATDALALMPAPCSIRTCAYPVTGEHHPECAGGLVDAARGLRFDPAD